MYCFNPNANRSRKNEKQEYMRLLREGLSIVTQRKVPFFESLLDKGHYRYFKLYDNFHNILNQNLKLKSSALKANFSVSAFS